MFSDDPYSSHNQNTIEIMREIFNSCDCICVREYTSLNYIKKYFSGIKASVYPDALFTWYELINDEH